MLAALGLGPAEEDVYRQLVARDTASLDELRAGSGLTEVELARVLAALVATGLATAQPPAPPAAEPTVFTAAPPAVALSGLLRRRRDDLRAAELDIAALADTHRRATMGRAADLIEVITDVDAVRHRFAQIKEAARHEVLSMVVPNLTVVPHRENIAGDACLRRGVRYQAIVDHRALDQPGMLQDTVASIAAGQEIRVVDRVPLKLVIVDRELAMLPLLQIENNVPASILVHRSGLLDAALAFYDATWERGYPLRCNASGDGVLETRPDRIDDLDAQVLALLLSGLTDRAIAGQVQLSL
jgi:sugar-specific transcriptional regulator TrmB